MLLTWKAPKDDGGSPITNYVLELRSEGAYKWKRVTKSTIESTSYTVKGLEEDTVYEFRVAAVNKAGQGPYSENTMPVKPRERVGKYWYLFTDYFFGTVCLVRFEMLLL